MFDVPESTALLVEFKAFLASDHITPATGKTIAITISKNGAAFGIPAAGALNATQIANGWYKAALTAPDADTVGPLIIHGAEGTIDPIGVLYNVKAASSGLVNVNAELVDGAAPDTPATVAAATVTAMDASSSDLNNIQTVLTAISGRLPAALVSGKIDASVGALGADVITNASLAASAVTEIQTGLATSAAVGALPTVASITALSGQVTAVDARLDTEIPAIKTKTDFLPSATAGATGGLAIVGSAMTLSAGERDATAAALLNLANGVMTGYTPGRALRVFLAALAGKVAISGTTVNIRDILDSINAISSVTTADGQRTSVTVNQT